jgi:orotidine-5'-phosphate decarboxylase
MSFVERLIELIKEKQSVVCMGLDPRMDMEGEIPQYLITQLDTPNEIILEFNKILIDETHDLIPVVKPQIAFYEKYEAFNALKETIKYAHKKGLLVILDSKRNDIGSTCEAYAYSMFKNYHADACTINAYLGIDGIRPFLEFKERGVFVLVKTSNPSSNDFQNLFSVKLDNVSEEHTEIKTKQVILKRNYIQMSELINEWSKDLHQFYEFTNLGAVVGATYSNELKKIRELLKNSFILIPGYGAQGARANDVKYGFKDNALGGIVNSSRNIIYAYKKNNKFSQKDFNKAAREKIILMNQEINSVIGL